MAKLEQKGNELANDREDAGTAENEGGGNRCACSVLVARERTRTRVTENQVRREEDKSVRVKGE